MISTILLIFTVLIIAVEGFLGFRRGALKQGIRMALWFVLFAVFCLFVPNMTTSLSITITEGVVGVTAVDMEQLIAELLAKVDILKEETYLIQPLASLICSFIVPFLVIVAYWISGLLSEIIFIIVANVCLKEKEQKPTVALKVAGLILGIFMALFGGILTIYPVATVSSAIKTGDVDKNITSEFEVTELVANAYKGTPVQLFYKFTATEWLAGKVHTGVINKVVAEKEQNIWAELPNIVKVGSCGLELYSDFSDLSKEGTSFDIRSFDTNSFSQKLSKTIDALFGLEFISNDNKLLLLNNLKTNFRTASGDKMVSNILEWFVLESKEQIVSDVDAYLAVVDVLKTEGILDVVLDGQGSFVLTEKAGENLINNLYKASNAEIVIPGILNMVYSMLLGDEEAKLIRENLVLDEKGKADISEVVSAICRISSLLEDMDTLSITQKKVALDAMRDLKDNEAIGTENYEALLQHIMDMTGISENVAVPEVLEILENPKVQEMLDDPEVLEILEEPEIQEILEAPEMLEKLDDPETLEQLENSELREKLEDSELREKLEDPEIQEMLKMLGMM